MLQLFDKKKEEKLRSSVERDKKSRKVNPYLS
jgi:hypothetical protein